MIKEGLYNSGVIFKDQLDNLRLSEKQFDRLTTEYPDYEGMANVYYHLFLLHSRKGDTQRAEEYVRLLQEQYPDNEWTTILTDPNFIENSRLGVHMEDSLYAATYEAFKANRSQEVDANVVISDTRFPLGANRDKFVFIGGLSKLNNGDVEGCLTAMNTVVEKYPNSRISEMAGMIVNGVKAGKSIHGGKFDLDDVWSRRTAVFSDSDSIAARKLSDERNTEFLFVIAYSPDSVNENQLLYQMARFNFTSFIVRNFDANIAALRAFLLSKTSYFRLEDTYHPTEYRMAYYRGPFTPAVNQRLNAAKFDLVFNVKPQRFLKSGEESSSLISGERITNPTRFTARPLIRFSGNGTMTFRMTGYNPITITITNNTNSSVIIDCDTMDCYNGTTNRNNDVTISGTDFPMLRPGTTLIEYTFESSFQTLPAITPRWWTV